VDYAGHPCDYAALRRVTERRGLALVAERLPCHRRSYRGKPVGSLADLSTFSFHPVKHITTGEGGAISTDDTQFASRMRTFRNHGITSDHRQRPSRAPGSMKWLPWVTTIGLPTFKCALGLAQPSTCRLGRPTPADRAMLRHESHRPLVIDAPFEFQPRSTTPTILYVVPTQNSKGFGDRRATRSLRSSGRRELGSRFTTSQYTFILLSEKRFQTAPGLCPIAEAAYQRILSLPIFSAMDDRDVERVIEVAHAVCTPA